MARKIIENQKPKQKNPIHSHLPHPIPDTLLVANGVLPKAEFVQEIAHQHDFIIAIDGATQKLLNYGILPDLITGDFDSIDENFVHAIAPNLNRISTPDQNFADIEKAIRLIIEFGGKKITVIGILGGRPDFTIAHIAVLLRYHKEIDCIFADETSDIRAVSTEITLDTNLGDTISLVTFQEDVRVTLRGTEWELEDAILPIGTHGVSNIACENSIHLQVQNGVVLLFKQT